MIFFSMLGGLDLVRIQGGALAFSRRLSFVYLLCHGLPGALSSTCFVTDFRVWGSLFGMPQRDQALQHMLVPSVLGGFSRSLSVRDWEPYEVDAIAVGAMLPSSEVSCRAFT